MTWTVPRTAQQVNDANNTNRDLQMKRIVKAIKDLPFLDQLLVMQLLCREDPKRVMAPAAGKWATKYSKDVRAYDKMRTAWRLAELKHTRELSTGEIKY